MKRPASAAPKILLGTRSLSGVSLVTRDRILEIVTRYREPESLAVTLSKALDAGVDGILSSPTPTLHAALAELKRPVPIYAVLPVLTEHERHELDPGIEGALQRMRERAGPGARARIGLAGLTRPRFLFRGDLARRWPLMLAAGKALVPKRSLRGVVVDAWLTDVALAAGNRRFFEAVCRSVRGRAHAGFETHNLGVLLAKLKEWQVRPDLVIGPVNASGLMMKPSVAEVLDEIAKSEIPVVAKELRAGGVQSFDQGVRFARAHGVHGIAPDLAELDDVAAELRGLTPVGD